MSLYNSRIHEVNERLLSELKNQLPPPVLITGDFNSYHPIWASDTADSRVTQVADFNENNNLNILNNGNALRILEPSRFSIDLFTISPSLQPQIEWSVSESPLDSDHCIFEMKIQTCFQRVQDKYKTFNIKKPNWAKFLIHAVRNHDQNLVQDLPAEQQMHKVYATGKTAAEVPILKAIIRKLYPKSWWSKELTEARDTSETFYGIHQKKNNE